MGDDSCVRPVVLVLKPVDHHFKKDRVVSVFSLYSED